MDVAGSSVRSSFCVLSIACFTGSGKAIAINSRYRSGRVSDLEWPTMRYLLSTTAVLAVLCVAPVARADEVTLVAPGGIQAAVQQLIPGFERATGHKVKATFGSGLGTKRQVAAGEPFDVPIIQPPYPEVVSSGHVVVDSATPLAAVAVGVAVRTGQRKPDISTPEAVKKLLLSVHPASSPKPPARPATAPRPPN